MRSGDLLPREERREPRSAPLSDKEAPRCQYVQCDRPRVPRAAGVLLDIPQGLSPPLEAEELVAQPRTIKEIALTSPAKRKLIASETQRFLATGALLD
jgi:hypothetical protein